MNSYEHQRLRKQYYRAYDIPFCKCGGTFHYDKDICEFVCDECGTVVKVIDRDRSKKGCKKKEPGKCWYCGKPIKKKWKKFCSKKCTDLYYKKKNWDESFTKKIEYDTFHKQLIEDYDNRFEEDEDMSVEFKEDDNKWGLGESNLNGKKLNSFKKELREVRKEKERLMGREPNP